MARNVAHIPNTYPIKQVLKQGRENAPKFLGGFFLMQLSISNFKHKLTKIPGITISPNPNILNFSTPSSLMQGNKILIGISRFLATVTITSVPYTQNISQKNNNHSNRLPTMKLLRLILRRATIENKIPKILLSAQYLVAQYKPTGIEHSIVQKMLACDTSKSSISRIIFIIFGGCTRVKTLFIARGKGTIPSSRLEVEIIVARQN